MSVSRRLKRFGKAAGAVVIGFVVLDLVATAAAVAFGAELLRR